MADLGGETTEVSVIVPTYRRPESLARTLEGLAHQREVEKPWEVLVVDNEPPPGSESVVAEVVDGFPVPLHYLRERQQGAAHARNAGLAKVRGAVCAMIDDDEVPDPHWLSNLVDPVLSGECDGTGGRVILDPTVPRPAWLDEVGIGGYLGSIDRGLEQRALKEGELVGSGNGAFRIELLRSIGGFDPAFGRRGSALLAGEDDLLTQRALEAGARLLYVPGALTVHELPANRLRRAYFLRRAWGQGRSDWRLQRGRLERRRLHGAREALSWLAVEAGRRRKEGLGRAAVRFHAACDFTRVGGALYEAASWSTRSRSA